MVSKSHVPKYRKLCWALKRYAQTVLMAELGAAGQSGEDLQTELRQNMCSRNAKEKWEASD